MQRYRQNRRHLRKDRAKTTLTQQDIGWDESDSNEGEEKEGSLISAKPTNTTADTLPTKQDHQQLTSRFGRIIKPTQRYIERSGDKH